MSIDINNPSTDGPALGAALRAAMAIGLEPATNGVASSVAFDVDGVMVEAPKPFVSITDYNTAGDGVASDAAAVDAAATAGPVFLPAGIYNYPGSNAGSALGTKRFFGIGAIKTGINKRAPNFSAISTAPTKGGEVGIDTAFNGDWSKTRPPVEHRITGAATLGQPTSGYKFTPEAYPDYMWLYNSSGWNEETGEDGGRTAAVARRTVVTHVGLGDGVAYNASVFVSGAKPGATKFLANPAAVCFNGGTQAGQNGVYLNACELIAQDNGYDVAANNFVSRLYRTNGTGALSAYWTAFRAQSQGAEPADVAWSTYGKFKRGLDTGLADFGTDQAAISLKADQRIYGNNAVGSGSEYSRTVNSDYIVYSSTLPGWRIYAGGVPALSISTAQITVASVPLIVGTYIRSGFYQVGTDQVLGARNTGWSAMTGTTNKATVYDTATVTLAQLAGRVMALQSALTIHGAIGA